MKSAHPDTVLIIDFGSQVTQLIARRVREAGVYSEIVPFQSAEAAFERIKPKAVILSGGPASTTEIGSPRAPDMRLHVRRAGARHLLRPADHVRADGRRRRELADHREFGRAFVEIEKDCPLFDGVWATGERHQVWMSHGDRVISLPDGFEVFGTSEGAPFAVIADAGPQDLRHHVPPRGGAHAGRREAACRTSSTRSPASRATGRCAPIREHAVETIREQVGTGKVICGLSGGVDSSVAAVLIHEAIGDQLTCIFVDHGLMRQNEAEEVVAMFRGHYNIPLVHVDAADLFLDALEGESDPETKRKTIGRLFIEVFEAEAKKIGGADFLAQGTLYPGRDRERVLHRRPVGHHQVAPQCRRPARAHEHASWSSRCANCSRTRCARSAANSACPSTSSAAIRFPGPGLAIRCPGGITREKLDILRKADAIYLDEIRKAGLYDAIWQAFAVLLPVQTVGVMGDGAHLRIRLRAARRDLGRRHDRRLLPLRHELPRRAPPPASSTRCAASTASSTTSPRSRPARSSGSDGGAVYRFAAGLRTTLILPLRPPPQ